MIEFYSHCLIIQLYFLFNRGLYGNLGYLDQSFEKLSPKSEKTLVGSGTQIMNQTSSEDPVLKNVIYQYLTFRFYHLIQLNHLEKL